MRDAGANVNALGLRTLLLLLALAAQTASGCAHHPPPSVRELFGAIQVGMPCSEVEARLGPAVARHSTVLPPRVGDDVAWYLPPPELGPADSPWGEGSICVRYTADNRVACKSLNPQCREPEDTLADHPQQPAVVPSGSGGPQRRWPDPLFAPFLLGGSCR